MKGTWNGYYRFNSAAVRALINYETMNFTIYIDSFDGKNFKGTVTDDTKTGGMTGTGEIIGHVNNGSIKFKKKMPYETIIHADGTRSISDKPHPILFYSGELSDDKESAKGQWHFKLKFYFLFGVIPILYRPAR